MTTQNDVFGARTTLKGISDNIIYYQLDALTKRGITGLERLPFTVKIILENLLRHAGGELDRQRPDRSLAGPERQSVSLFLARQTGRRWLVRTDG